MKNHLENHPLNGINLEMLLTNLVDHYGWDILAAQIPINCFTSYPSIKSSLKFLRKTTWARERLEAFYLYQYCQYPRPSDDEHSLVPRERYIDTTQGEPVPVVLSVDDPEFFDDPASGPILPSKREVAATQASSKKSVSVDPYKRSIALSEAMAERSVAPKASRRHKPNDQAPTSEPRSDEPTAETPKPRTPQSTKVESDHPIESSANPWSKALAKLGDPPNNEE